MTANHTICTNKEELAELKERELQKQAAFKHRVFVCMGTACQSCQSSDVLHSLEAEVKARGLDDQYLVTEGGCQGNCTQAPLVSVQPNDCLYERVKPSDAKEIIERIDSTVERLSCDMSSHFFAKQKRIVTEFRGLLNPNHIEDYIAAGGYTALFRVLNEFSKEQVIQEIRKSGLRGRGGAGYPTGLKWSTVAKALGAIKYVVCNADEGDPGAFMNRSVLEDYPFKVLEGMTIAAYAVGASKGYVYLRAEYPLAVKRLEAAIVSARQHGFLGNNIGGTAFTFDLEIRLGAGAFVCGEETALISSIEGGRGLPCPRPPYPAESGLWGCPTLINNVETHATIASIINNGADWYSSIGTEKSKGTKTFALSGRIKNTGLIEIPLGTSLKEVIFDIGGGVPDGHRFKAVQTGGPAGGCIPETLLDTPIDYESLQTLGSFMGSGGMIVMDDTSCMVDVAKFFMQFCASESCGKCVPCRVGTVHMHTILERITKGEATLADLAQLETLCDVVKDTSLCGLGQGAPNPVLSTLKFFRGEYLAHIINRTCLAGVCAPVGQDLRKPTCSL
ncbi:MAG: NADH-ubiquinone oxidoreductase-F iron-sulfur binding region domain-containing protein [Candidatus Obscuribacterales bacterium]|nr:NADH-ubiquinone oxidoreductase-F iron-sulfur binding region domain-containing protein [Candidatus Obscuribacterales bacterium]